MFRSAFHLPVDLDPETLFSSRVNFTESVNTAAAGTVNRLFGTTGPVTEKAAGIKHTVAAHGTPVKQPLGEELLEP